MRFWTRSSVSFLFRVICTSHNAHPVAGHRALWEERIEQGDISIGNLMCDPVTKRGVLNDFDLARLSAPNRKPSTTDNTGTLPFLALDLLNERALKGQVPRLYRHEAESFTWCLIYICICMGKDKKGRIDILPRHPLSSWFTNMDSCRSSKADLSKDGLLDEFPLHQDIGPLVSDLYNYWLDRFSDQERLNRAQNSLKWTGTGRRRKYPKLPPGLSVNREDPALVQTTQSYDELPDRERFKQVFQVILDASDVIPDEKEEIFFEIITRVTQSNPILTSVEGETEASN